jgi:hypothetical protein
MYITNSVLQKGIQQYQYYNYFHENKFYFYVKSDFNTTWRT